MHIGQNKQPRLRNVPLVFSSQGRLTIVCRLVEGRAFGSPGPALVNRAGPIRPNRIYFCSQRMGISCVLATVRLSNELASDPLGVEYVKG